MLKFFIFLSILIPFNSYSSELAISNLRSSVRKLDVGTGFILETDSQKKYLVTNWHVCQDESEIKVFKSDRSIDLCVEEESMAYFGLRVAKSLSLKEQLYAKGFPAHKDLESAGINLGPSSWDCKPLGITFHDNFTTLYSRPGSSGSPVVNEAGELVGVISSYDADSQAGMVTLENIKKFFQGL